MVSVCGTGRDDKEDAPRGSEIDRNAPRASGVFALLKCLCSRG